MKRGAVVTTPEMLCKGWGVATHQAHAIGTRALHFAELPVELGARTLRQFKDQAESFLGVFIDPKHAANNALLSTLGISAGEADYKAQLGSEEVHDWATEVKCARQICNHALQILKTPAGLRSERDNVHLSHAREALQNAPRLLLACSHLSADDTVMLTSFVFPSSTPR